MKPAINNILIILALAFSLFRCGPSDTADKDAHGHGEEAHRAHEEDENSGVVELSELQLANIDLRYGTLDTVNVSAFVKANGTLDLPPQNIAAVSAPMDGFVKKANYLVGDYVEKGTVLAILEHLDYISLQEEYLNVVTNLDFLVSDFERQRQLDSAQVNSKKQFQAASAALKSAKARKKALEKQLRYMGISPENVAQGEITSTIAIRAPFSGYITALNVHNGAYAESAQELYEIIDPAHMHLELNVFEQDMSKIKKGQPIRFTVPSTGQESYQGEVFLVGKSFVSENKSVKVHGHIQGEHDNFIRGLYVEAKIYTGNEQVQALPEEAVVMDGGNSYIFVRTNRGHAHEEKKAVAEHPAEEEVHGHEENAHEDHAHEGHAHEEHAHEGEEHKEGGHDEHGEGEEQHGTLFRQVQVVTGEKDQGFVQIKQMPNLPTDTEIVTKGAYFLFSEMKKGEGGHHH